MNIQIFLNWIFFFFLKLANTQKLMSSSFQAQNYMQKKDQKLYKNDEKWVLIEQERYFSWVKHLTSSLIVLCVLVYVISLTCTVFYLILSLNPI